MYYLLFTCTGKEGDRVSEGSPFAALFPVTTPEQPLRLTMPLSPTLNVCDVVRRRVPGNEGETRDERTRELVRKHEREARVCIEAEERERGGG